MKLLRKEMYQVKRPNHIIFGDPDYFKTFRGERLQSLVCDLFPPKAFDARIVLRTELKERIGVGDEELFARMKTRQLTRRTLKLYLAPAEPMQTYLDNMQYVSQLNGIKEIGVDAARYRLAVDSRELTIQTGADGYWGNVETLYRIIDGKQYDDAIIITVIAPDSFDFNALKRMTKYLFPDMKQIERTHPEKNVKLIDR